MKQSDVSYSAVPRGLICSEKRCVVCVCVHSPSDIYMSDCVGLGEAFSDVFSQIVGRCRTQETDTRENST